MTDPHEQIAFLKSDSQKCTIHCFPKKWTLISRWKSYCLQFWSLTAPQIYSNLTSLCVHMFNLPDYLLNLKQKQVQRWEFCFGPYGLQHRHFNWQLPILLSMAADSAMLTTFPICCESGSTLQFYVVEDFQHQV